jgi:hypothetical protein
VVLGFLLDDPLRELLGGGEPRDVLREGDQRVVLLPVEQRVVGVLVERGDDLLDALVGEHGEVLRPRQAATGQSTSPRFETASVRSRLAVACTCIAATENGRCSVAQVTSCVPFAWLRER